MDSPPVPTHAARESNLATREGRKVDDGDGSWRQMSFESGSREDDPVQARMIILAPEDHADWHAGGGLDCVRVVAPGDHDLDHLPVASLPRARTCVHLAGHPKARGVAPVVGLADPTNSHWALRDGAPTTGPGARSEAGPPVSMGTVGAHGKSIVASGQGPSLMSRVRAGHLSTR